MTEHFTREAKLVQLAADAQIIDRKNVAVVARIIGPNSAAAEALKRADEHTGRSVFWYSKKLGMLSVQLLKETVH